MSTDSVVHEDTKSTSLPADVSVTDKSDNFYIFNLHWDRST